MTDQYVEYDSSKRVVRHKLFHIFTRTASKCYNNLAEITLYQNTHEALFVTYPYQEIFLDFFLGRSISEIKFICGGSVHYLTILYITIYNLRSFIRTS